MFCLISSLLKRVSFLEERESYVDVWRNWGCFGRYVATRRSIFSKFRRAVLTNTFLLHDQRGKLGILILRRLLKMVAFSSSSHLLCVYSLIIIILSDGFYYAAVALPSHAIGSIPASNAPLLQPAYLYSSSDSQYPASSSSSLNHESTNLPKPVIQGIVTSWFDFS